MFSTPRHKTRTMTMMVAITRPFSTTSPKPMYSPHTPLLQEIQLRIKSRGPVSVSEFMRLALTHPVHGYYSRSSKNVFGPRGDFITSPEISQLFGEMIGIWCVDTWNKLGSPKRFKICELGPGRGTLMRDILRTLHCFPPVRTALTGIHFIETSNELQLEQKSNIATFSQEKDVEFYTSLAEYNFKTFETKTPTIFIAQEFLDALPVHQFEYVSDKGWCERLVDVGSTEEDEAPGLDGQTHHLRFVLSPGPTPASKILMRDARPMENQKGYLTRVEFSMDAMSVVQDMARIVNRDGGAGIIVDYGTDTGPPADSLRGILNHQFVHPLQEPGLVDLSVDVDFSSLRRMLENEHVGMVAGPKNQGDFLKSMGIEVRVAQLLRSIGSHNEDEQVKLFAGFKRLVDPKEMGVSYKVLGFATKPDDVGKIANEATNAGKGRMVPDVQQPPLSSEMTNSNDEEVKIIEAMSKRPDVRGRVDGGMDGGKEYAEFTRKFGFEMAGF